MEACTEVIMRRNYNPPHWRARRSTCQHTNTTNRDTQGEMGEVAAQTCTSTSSTTSIMAYGCDLTRVFTYEGSETDIYINCE